MNACFSFVILICIGYVYAQNTTLPPTTTTPLPTPPTPTEGYWNVTDGNITCIRALMKIRFTIPTPEEKVYLLLSPGATTDGSSCDSSNTTQTLKLNDNRFGITFVFERESGNVVLKNVTLVVNSPEAAGTYSNDTTLFTVKNGHSYICKSTTSIPLNNNATMDIFDMHLQAFGGTEKDFGVAEECETDDNVSDVVPIAVACALAALIIVVLIAYLIGRRRSRQKGYNSV